MYYRIIVCPLCALQDSLVPYTLFCCPLWCMIELIYLQMKYTDEYPQLHYITCKFLLMLESMIENGASQSLNKTKKIQCLWTPKEREPSNTAAITHNHLLSGLPRQVEQLILKALRLSIMCSPSMICLGFCHWGPTTGIGCYPCGSPCLESLEAWRRGLAPHFYNSGKVGTCIFKQF